ncbi:uncharacterized protein LOC100898875, partial [Galendromus occidentalis]|uniref:Uncharacterized protein LOC100898875 n=1 Tax=Galendromus occidentalis TaxID=34638 RepID=A0AAJ6QNC4_9ACAR
EFQAKVLDFGLICSPWLHIKGVRYHLESCKSQFPAEAEFIEEISTNLYMDDVCIQADSVADAEHKINLLFEIFQQAHFPLRKWGTANEEVAHSILRLSPLDKTSVTVGDEEAKFLGVQWHQPTDSLGVFTRKAVSELSSGTPSKRKLLKGLAQIYDPLGILTPVTVRAKTLFQSLWKLKIDWDDPLPTEIIESYRNFVTMLRQSTDIRIERALSARFSTARFELHSFCDASLEAYGAAIYLRTVDKGFAQARLVVAKARVAPTKQKWSIHRYELMGALMAARITSNIREYLKLKVAKEYFWIDNMACVSWIHSPPEKWRPFVANRVREITKLTDPSAWRYIRSEENPADILSRGTDIANPQSRYRWLSGPMWLSDPTWKPPPNQIDIEETAEERKATPSQCLHTVRYDENDVIDDLLNPARFSSWFKLIRAQAFCNRLKAFAQSIKSRQRRSHSSSETRSLQLDTAECTQAEKDLVRRIQKRYFREEISQRCEDLPKSSGLAQFHPFIDSDGLMRCRSQSAGDWGGVAATLQKLRERFFILKARKVAYDALRHCPGCKRFNANPATEPTPALPTFRVEITPPFLFTGVDFAGPIYYKKENGRKAKSYILLFTCAVSRAIHLELTMDLSTYEVLRALSP